MASKQKKFFDEPIYFSKPAWVEGGELIGAEIARQKFRIDAHKRQLIELDGKLVEFQWAIGDWLLMAEDGGLKARELKNEARRLTGRPWGTLKNIKSVARAIESSRRRDDLSYSHHVEVAKFEPEMQDRILDEAVERHKNASKKHPFSVGQMRTFISDLQRQEKWQKLERLSGDEKKAAFEKEQHENREKLLNEKIILKGAIRLTRREAEYLSEIVRAGGHGGGATTNRRQIWCDPMPAIFWMAFEYFKQHKEELKAKVEAFSAERQRREEQEKARIVTNAEGLNKLEEWEVSNSDDSYDGGR